VVIGLGGDPADDSLNNRDADSNLFADLNDEDEPDIIGGDSDNFNSTIQVRDQHNKYQTMLLLLLCS
jgi:hypothetical protein